MPNPWDEGSAVLLESLGFEALATTSAGFAFSIGRPDEGDAVPVKSVLGHIAAIVGATSLPVNADFQSGYADDEAGVAENVARCVAAGVAGLSIEDASGEAASPLYDAAQAIERVRAAREAIDRTGIPVVLTARCEAALVGQADALGMAADRLVAYADAGADCLYAPGLDRTAEIETIVRAVAPKPVNVLVTRTEELTTSLLADLGVRRISVGSGLARVAWAGLIGAAEEIASEGSFRKLGGGTPFSELNRLFGA